MNTTPMFSAAEASATQKSALIRYAEVTAFIGIYIGLGYIPVLREANIYLLLGIPLMFAFQLFVRRQPLRALWVRNSTKFSLNAGGIIVAVVLGLLMAADMLVGLFSKEKDVLLAFFSGAAVVGAVGVGFAFSKFTRQTWKYFLLCLLIGGGLGSAWLLFNLEGKPLHFNWPIGIVSLIQYVPVVFVMEEVIFRGMLDSHLHPPGAKHGIASAVFLSVLWAYWHLPILGELSLEEYALLPVTHILVGVPASLFWRKSGNLAVPGFMHAFVDAVRNGLM